LASADLFYIFSDLTNWFFDFGWCYFIVMCFGSMVVIN